MLTKEAVVEMLAVAVNESFNIDNDVIDLDAPLSSAVEMYKQVTFKYVAAFMYTKVRNIIEGADTLEKGMALALRYLRNLGDRVEAELSITDADPAVRILQSTFLKLIMDLCTGTSGVWDPETEQV